MNILMLGRRHAVVVDPELARAVLDRYRDQPEQKQKYGNEKTQQNQAHSVTSEAVSHFDDTSAPARVRSLGFGMPPPVNGQWSDVMTSLRRIYAEALDGTATPSDPRSDLEAKLESEIRASVDGLISFNDSPIDQNEWERAVEMTLLHPRPESESESAEPDPYAHVDVLELLQNYVLSIVSKALLGCSVPLECPNWHDDVRAVVDGFGFLVAGVSRGAPVAKGTRAHLARRRLLAGLSAFHTCLMRSRRDDEEEGDSRRDTSQDLWQDVDECSHVVGAIHDLFFGSSPESGDGSRLYPSDGVAADAAAAETLCLLVSLYARISALVYWTVVSVAGEDSILDRVRADFGSPGSGVGVTVKPRFMGYVVPPVVDLDFDALARRRDGVLARIVDAISRRRDRSWVSLRTGAAVSVDATDSTGKTNTRLSLPADEWVDIPLFDVSAALVDRSWTPTDEADESTSPDDHLPSLSAFYPLAPSTLSHRAVLGFSAAILSFWDFRSADDNAASTSLSTGFFAAIDRMIPPEPGADDGTVSSSSGRMADGKSGPAPPSGRASNSILVPVVGPDSCAHLAVAMPGRRRTKVDRVLMRRLRDDADAGGRGVFHSPEVMNEVSINRSSTLIAWQEREEEYGDKTAECERKVMNIPKEDQVGMDQENVADL